MKTVRMMSVLTLTAAVLISGCHVAVNRSVTIEDGERVTHDINVINGSVTIGDDCVVKGDVRSVNGGVRVGRKSETGDLQSVNGSIGIGAESVIHGTVGSVNGPVDCERGVTVRRSVSSVNGSIDLVQTEVLQDITTHNGNITLADRSEVRGDIIIKDSKGNRNPRVLYVRLEGGSIVHGDIENRDREQEVRVIISGGSEVKGRLRDVEVEEEEI